MDWDKMNDKPTFISLFRGIGGFDLGLTKAGWTGIWSNDNNKYANQIYHKHFPETKGYDGNIQDIDAKDIPDTDLLVGGFPCQPFSLAGERKGFNDSRGNLFFEIARILKDKRPKLLLLENVKGLLSAQNGFCLLTILNELDELGYNVEWKVLDTKNWIPQNRERIFIVGHLRRECTRPIFSEAFTSTEFNEWNAEEQVANSLQSPGHASANCRGMNLLYWANSADGWMQRNLNSNSPALKTQNDFCRQPLVVMEMRQSGFRQHRNDGLSPTLTQKMGTGGNNVPMVLPCLTPERINKHQHGRRFKDNGEGSFTLTSQDLHGIATNKGIRTFTEKECERLQGFPDNWTEGISKTQRYKALGNAVSVPVIEYIGKLILSTVGGKT